MILQEANTIRNDWQICRVMQTYYNEKGLVRSVRLKIGSVDPAGRNNIVDGPVSKFVISISINALQCSASMEFMERTMRIKCFKIIKFYFVVFQN